MRVRRRAGGIGALALSEAVRVGWLHRKRSPAEARRSAPFHCACTASHSGFPLKGGSPPIGAWLAVLLAAPSSSPSALALPGTASPTPSAAAKPPRGPRCVEDRSQGQQNALAQADAAP